MSVELQLGARAEGDGTNWSLRVYDAVDGPSALSKGQRAELKLVVRYFYATPLGFLSVGSLSLRYIHVPGGGRDCG